MCLNKIKKKYSKNDRMIVGYKIFIKQKDKLFPCFRKRVKPYKFGKHYRATNGKIAINNFDKYDAGFHAFTSSKEARRICSKFEAVCEVFLWDIRAEGIDSKRKTIVAKNMMIVREV